MIDESGVDVRRNHRWSDVRLFATISVTTKSLGCAAGGELPEREDPTEAYATMGDYSGGGDESEPAPSSDCDIGMEGCPCTPGGSCEQGLACEERGTCIPASEYCGDGVVNGEEECDDANEITDDGCNNSCVIASCGDGELQTGEACDDGNTDDEDGCTQSCECRASFEFETQVNGWELSGDWSLYSEAPMSSWAQVPFGAQGHALGTDGNRNAPYPGEESELSSATTPSFMIPKMLRFRSWHADEGGQEDNKRVLVTIDSGATWNALVDCAAGPDTNMPFCQRQDVPRGAESWDDIELDTTAYSGVPGQLRFEYEALDACCDFEQGWFIDDLSALGCF
jgi:cysteine-rich repeat protein